MAIFSAIGAAAAGAFGLVAGTTGFAIVSGLVGGAAAIAVGVGVSLIAKAIAGKKDQTTVTPGVSGRLQAGGTLNRSILFGLSMTAGSLVWANSWGFDGKTPNAHLTQVIALSDLPVKGLSEVWVNGAKVTLDGVADPHGRGYPALEYRSNGRDYLWVRFHDGSQSTADSFVTATAASAERPWPSTRVGSGVAYAVVTALIEPALFTGFPTFKFVTTGARLYDISKDSTAGGSGSQVWSNPATWGGDGDDLPAVQIYNLLRGVRWGSQWLYGLQTLGAARLPAARWIAAVNRCRAAVAGPSGSEPEYRAGGEISVGMQVSDTIEAFLTTCQGRLAEWGGIYDLHVGAPASSAFAIGDGDILSTEEQTFTPFFGLAETVTGVNASYPSRVEGWTVKTAPPLHDATLEARAGNRRLPADVDLAYCPYDGQVQRLMKAALAEAQRARRHTIVLGPKFASVRPNDFFAWTSERNGYLSKLFRVDGVADRPDGDIVLDITEVDPSDYDWDQEEDYRAPVDGVIGIFPPPPQPIIDFTADGVVEEIGGLQRVAILLTWDGEQDDVVRVAWEVRRDADKAMVVTGGTDSPERGSALVFHGLFSRTAYEVRARYLPGTARRTLWSDWLPVTTPNAPFNDILVELRAVQADMRNLFARVASQYEATIRPQLDRLALATTEGLGASHAEIAAVKRDGDAMAAAFLLLQAEVTSEFEAVAEAILGVEAQVGDLAAGGRISFRAQIPPPDGILAQIEVMARASDEDEFIESGMIIQVYLDGLTLKSRIALKTDQLIVTDGSANGTPFIFSSGNLTLASMRAQTITAGRWQNVANTRFIDLNTGTLDFQF